MLDLFRPQYEGFSWVHSSSSNPPSQSQSNLPRNSTRRVIRAPVPRRVFERKRRNIHGKRISSYQQEGSLSNAIATLANLQYNPARDGVEMAIPVPIPSPIPIPIPHFSSILLPQLSKRIRISRKLTDSLSDEQYSKRHRPMEIAERRARKRELEVHNYNRYVQSLKGECPQLRK